MAFRVETGLIGMKIDGCHGALVEVNSETDFVARNAKFQGFVEKALAAALREAGRGHGAASESGDSPAVRALDVQQLLESGPPGASNLGLCLAPVVG